jgi:hypothetical protein
MKCISVLSILFLSLLMGASCKKQTPGQGPNKPGVLRKVQFVLYTEKDFSREENLITFTAFIKNATNKTLWDSVLPSVKIKDIPKLANKITIEKTVPGNDKGRLRVGFLYTIENVGMSWHNESFDAGEVFKIVEFKFQ